MLTCMFFLVWPKPCTYFCLDAKVPKRSRLRLLSYSVTSLRCARRKLASLKQRRSGRSTSFLRLTLTRTRPILQLTIDNGELLQWRIENGKLKISNEGDCRGAALLRLKTALHNRMAINIITNNIIMFFACFFLWRLV